MSTFEAINFYHSFAHSAYEAAMEKKFYFTDPVSVRRARRLRRRSAVLSPPPPAVVSPPVTAGGVIEEDIKMSFYPPSPPSIPFSLPPTKRARLSSSSTTRCTTTVFWCVPDVITAIEGERNLVRSFFAAYATTVCLSLSSGVSVSVVVSNDVHTMQKIEGIAQQLVSLGVAGGFSGVVAPSLEKKKKRTFREVH